MKKFLFIFSLAAAVSVSCQKQCAVYAPDTNTNGEIVFRTNGVKVTTKAFTETTNDILQTNGFKVAAVQSSVDTAMFNKAVTYSNGVYSVPGEHYYFPNEGTMSFYAAYPATQAIAVASGAATIAYTQNANTDLVVAKATGVGKQNSPVQLDFEHILSQVTMTVKTDNENVVCKLFSITVNDANGGTYSFAGDGTWTLSDTKENYYFYEATAGLEKVVTTTAASVGSAMSFMPGDITVNAKWQCYNKTGGALISDNDETVSVTLTKGEHITLNLTLPANSSEITFVTSVGPWAEKDEDITLEPEPDALVSVNAAAGETVSLPVLDIASGTKGIIDWGDGKKEEFSNAGIKSSVSEDKITFSHTYASAFTGQVKVNVETGRLFGTVSAEEYELFSVHDANKVDINKPYAPELVGGIFTVDESGKKVRFAKGNLYWNGSEFRCEEHQYDCPTTRESSHVGHFFWSQTASVAHAASYNDDDISSSDKFFAADEGVFAGYTVLSKDEWLQLMEERLYKEESVTIKLYMDEYGYFECIGTYEQAKAAFETNAEAQEAYPGQNFDDLFGQGTITTEGTICHNIAGTICLILTPDGFHDSVPVHDCYSAEEWATAESAYGLVALPFTGELEPESTEISFAGMAGCYWSSTSFSNYPGSTDDVYSINLGYLETCEMESNRGEGLAIRLVKIVQ